MMSLSPYLLPSPSLPSSLPFRLLSSSAPYVFRTLKEFTLTASVQKVVLCRLVPPILKFRAHERGRDDFTRFSH